MSWPLTARSPARNAWVASATTVGWSAEARSPARNRWTASLRLMGWADASRSPARNRWTASWLSGGWAATAVAELRTASMAPSTIPRMSFDMGSLPGRGVARSAVAGCRPVPSGVGPQPAPGR